jgi:hypothetical protein
MRYVHAEDGPVRADAETVASPRRVVLSGQRANIKPANNATTTEQSTSSLDAPVAMPAGFDDGRYASTTKLGTYRPFRHCSGANRAVPPRTRNGKAKFIAGE